METVDGQPDLLEAVRRLRPLGGPADLSARLDRGLAGFPRRLFGAEEVR